MPGYAFVLRPESFWHYRLPRDRPLDVARLTAAPWSRLHSPGRVRKIPITVCSRIVYRGAGGDGQEVSHCSRNGKPSAMSVELPQAGSFTGVMSNRS